MMSDSVLIMISPKFVTKTYTSEPIKVKRATNNPLLISLRVDASSLLISPCDGSVSTSYQNIFINLVNAVTSERVELLTNNGDDINHPNVRALTDTVLSFSQIDLSMGFLDSNNSIKSDLILSPVVKGKLKILQHYEVKFSFISLKFYISCFTVSILFLFIFHS